VYAAVGWRPDRGVQSSVRAFADPGPACRIAETEQIARKPRSPQQALFADGVAERAAVDAALAFDFPLDGYAPARDYDGRFGRFDFRHHYYARIGDFDSQGEYACAEWLDMQAQKGRIRHWVRNLTRKNDPCAFFLQKADGRFYPDFVCLLPSGVVLAVEYKGDRWEAAADDRLIGGLWESLSAGRCRFAMAPPQDWSVIEAKL
jgi:type III restriction enzyme